MKTKSFLLIFCLFLGGFTIHLSAQSIEKTYQGWGNGTFFTEVFCDGEQVDFVEGVLKVHYVRHYAGGAWYQWDIYQAKGYAQSTWTGEIFKYKEVDKVSYEDGVYAWHYHLKGNKGNTYSGKVIMDMETEEITPINTHCK